MIQTPKNWKEYELIDAGDGEKLEKWGKYILRRPDPQAIWSKNLEIEQVWENPDLFYHRSDKGGGYWEVRNTKDPFLKSMEEAFKHTKSETKELSIENQRQISWEINYKELKFKIKPSGFKHTGLFPEQAINWEWIIEKIRETKSKDSKREIKVLNLFAYTGGATAAATFADATVVHVDASKGMNMIAKENIELSGLDAKRLRFIQDDVMKFVEREIRRGSQYDLIIMDPPTYGRGAKKEMWQIEKNLNYLVELCSQLLSPKCFGFIINTYATEISTYSFENILKTNIIPRFGGKTEALELGLNISTKRGDSELILPTGMTARWFKQQE